MINNSEKTKFGKMGEEIAACYLIKNGYTVIHRNFTLKFNEIDIVGFAKDKTLVFIEVKTIKELECEGLTPEDQLTSEKYKNLVAAAQIFAGRYPELIDEERGWRIDLVGVVLGVQGELVSLRHYENI